MKKHPFLILSVLLSVLILVGTFSLFKASAGPLLQGSGAPTVVSYQGIVKDGGSPYTGTGYFKFAVVNAAGDTTYWSNDGTSSGGGEPDTYVTLTVANGLFHVLLGDTNLTNMTALPASTFSGTERYLRIWFSSGSITFTLLSPDQRIAAVPYALQAEEALHAADADTLDGLDSTDLYTRAEVDALLAAQDARIADLETKLASVSLENGGEDFVFTGVNVHVRDGSGDTGSDVNGLGNLIVGYDEARPSGSDKSGSHNLVVGRYHNYTSYGGFVAGSENTISSTYASVSGGRGNTASGDFSSVSGGWGNTASGYASSISGGIENTASGYSSSVSGGLDNTANANYSSVSGGRYNVASGDWSSVLGGGGDAADEGNEAWADYSIVAGGRSNVAGDDFGADRTVGEASAVLAGLSNRAEADLAAVSGGVGNAASGYASSISGGTGNGASGSYSSISGGWGNTASGFSSSVSGGSFNTASGERSSVSGGSFNIASEYASSISGGESNTASGDYSSVSGGYENTASGSHSSVSGGYQRSVSGNYDWRAGDLFETQ